MIRLATTKPVEALTRAMAKAAGVPDPDLRWRFAEGPLLRQPGRDHPHRGPQGRDQAREDEAGRDRGGDARDDVRAPARLDPAARQIHLRRMAEVRPLHALHYSLGSVSSLGDVVAPPYDVIDAAMREALLERSPFNVVEIDLPVSPGGGDPYEHAAETLENWTLEGILAADREEALLGARAGVRGARRLAAHSARIPLPRPSHRLRPRPRPPARAHAARAQGGPPAPDPGDAPQPLPHLLPPRGKRLAASRVGNRRASPGARPPTPTAPSTASGASPTQQ